MENFINLAKQYASGDDKQQQQQQQVQGGAQYNAPHGQGGSSGSSGGGLGDLLSMFNQGSAVQGAEQELDTNQKNDPNVQSMLQQGFAQATAYGSRKTQNNEPVDLNEDGVIDDYERAYARGEAQKGEMSSKSMGTAAAMSAFKKFMGNDSQAKQQAAPSGDMTSKLIGMAMAEAMKLFNSSGGKTADGGSQQDIVNAASKQIMKMMLKSQLSGSTGTGGGAMGGLMNMAGKFLTK